MTDYIVTEDGDIISREDGSHLIREGEVTTIRIYIMAAIATRLVTILTTNGYRTSIGSHVFIWRDTEQNPLGSAEVPGILYRDISDTPEPHTFGTELHKLIIEFRLAATGSSVENSLRQAIADLEVAFNTDRTLNAYALESFLDTNEAEVAHLENKIGIMTVSMEVWYRTVAGDPYTLA